MKTLLHTLLLLHFITISVTQLSDKQCKLPSDLTSQCFCANNNYLQCSGLNSTTSFKHLDQNLSNMLTQIEIINSDITCINLGHFAKIVSLTELRVRYSELSSVFCDKSEKVKYYLSTLDLSHNKLSTIDIDVSPELTNIVHLNLSHNRQAA